MATVNMEVRFDSYIAHPYWPETSRLVDITKESGMNRARTEANKEKALRNYLEPKGLTTEDFHELERLAARPFYKDGNDEWIVIPKHQIYGCLTAAADSAGSALRVVKSDNLRSLLKMTDWVTNRKEQDNVFGRFVLLKSGTGQTLSNQRKWTENPYIENFEARGSIQIDLNQVKVDKLRDFMEYAGREHGVGASRKMDYGRYSVTAFAVEE